LFWHRAWWSQDIPGPRISFCRKEALFCSVLFGSGFRVYGHLNVPLHNHHVAAGVLAQAAYMTARDQLPELATLASDVNGFVGMHTHGLPGYGPLAQEYAPQNNLVVDPGQRMAPAQLHHHHHQLDGPGQPPPGQQQTLAPPLPIGFLV
jgi:hypothetical protein